ncbi:MAG: ribonuclease HII, partial [Mobilicoccus sp.]|nr:ribonuclease HII [Mobilicoccus sp.]
PDLVLLDGKHDWLTPPPRPAAEDVLFEMTQRPEPQWPAVPVPTVRTRIKADMACSSVAAASILAKVERDTHMVDLARAHPEYAEYGWDVNKGYAAPTHRAALTRLGACDHHRRSWRLQLDAPALAGSETPRPGGPLDAS